jgi:hypothetical protein
MNYRGKDKLAEALKKGLLETARPKKDEPVISEALAARLAAYQEPSNETVKDISGVASALTPKRQPWEIVEEKKPIAPVIVESKAPQKTLKEIASTVRLNKVEEKPLIINESTDSIAGVLTNQGKRLWRPARKESLEEKVERLESELSLFEEGSHEYLKKIHAGATTKRHDGWSEHVISHGGKKYRLVTNGVRAAMENYRGHVVPHKKVASIVSKLAESVEEYSEDGRGRHKVNYIHPDKKNIGNDRFETRAEATRYANALKKKGYHNVTIGESVEQLDEFKKGEDIGKPGLNFKKVAAKAAKEYGSKAAGKRVAGAVLQKILHKEEVEHLNEETEPKHKFNKVLAKHGYVYKGTHTEKSLGGRDHDFPSHNYEHPTTGSKVHVWQQKGSADTYHTRHKQTNGITAPGHGDTKGQLDRNLERWAKYKDGLERSGLREDVEQLDELKASTLGRYIRKSQKDASVLPQKIEAEKEGDRHWPEPYKHGPKLQRKLNNRNTGMDRAERALDRKDKKLKEDVEQLDELSRDTLASYVHKASFSLGDIQNNVRNNGANKVESDKKFAKRDNGIKQAVQRLTKKTNEEVEQLDELSADALTKYGDKAWRSKMNAHIDRGGADYLDDDKARKTATRTIGKRERGLALAKAMMKKKEC